MLATVSAPDRAPEIKPLRAADAGLLEEFTYLAIFVPDGTAPPPRDVVLTEPGLRNYWQDFGGRDDHGVAAIMNGQAVGAAWSRLLTGQPPGYGNIDADTPELGVAVVPGMRGRGIGGVLLDNLFAHLVAVGCPRISLSVQRENPAVRLYRRAGFVTVRDNGEDRIMVKTLAGPTGAS
jgi:ribosomal protein S18 acetylase RimI-like enzyme